MGHGGGAVLALPGGARQHRRSPAPTQFLSVIAVQVMQTTNRVNRDFQRKIKEKLEQLRKQIRNRDESEILVWVIPDSLACSQRPLRDHPDFGGHCPLPPAAKPLVIDWVQRIKSTGIRSIICLLVTAQLERYYGGSLGLHEDGLLGYYKSQGFHVRHYPLTDYQPPLPEQKEEILRLYDALPKPILLHCSAAIDRTAPVAAFISERRNARLSLTNKES